MLNFRESDEMRHFFVLFEASVDYLNPYRTKYYVYICTIRVDVAYTSIHSIVILCIWH